MNIAPWKRRIIPFLFVAAVLAPARGASATIRYSISLGHPEQHMFHVTMQVPDAGHDLIVAMPAWNATYDIRDFAYRVTHVRVANGNDGAQNALNVVKLDKQTWRISAESGGSEQTWGQSQFNMTIIGMKRGRFRRSSTCIMLS